MTTFLAHRSDQVGSVAQAARPFLESDPVRHNLLLTLLRDRIARPEPGRYWWVTENGVVRGVGLQSPLTFRAALTPMPLDAIGALADAVVAVAPGLPGVGADAVTASAFAGAWTERTGGAARVTEGQRIYRADAIVEPKGVDGALRVATRDDLDLVVAWFDAFHREVDDLPGGPRLAETARVRVDAGVVWLWEAAGDVVSSAMVTPGIAGAARIGFVYTPPERRGHGYAAAAVARLSTLAMGAGQPFGRVEVCLLYTQLHNATSNRVYRRLGYRAVGEGLVYAFEPS